MWMQSEKNKKTVKKKTFYSVYFSNLQNDLYKDDESIV